MCRAKDFLLNFTYPDGSAVAVIDERNRYYQSVAAGRGLHALSHFPDGRRFCRIIARILLDRLETSGRHPLSSVLLASLVDFHRYSVEGPESQAPQELDRYEARLVSGAYLMRRGPWIVTLSGIISPPWEGNRFFLDRYTYLEIWHEKTGLLIGGGNTKRQPQIATVLMEPSHGALDFWPRDSRITAKSDSAALQLNLELFRARLTLKVLDSRRLAISVDFTETADPILWPNRYECNLQLRLRAGEQISTSAGETLTLSSRKSNYLEEQIGSGIETAQWSIQVPPGSTSLRFPFIPFFNYDIDGIGSTGSAVGILSAFTTDPNESFEYILKVK